MKFPVFLLTAFLLLGISLNAVAAQVSVVSAGAIGTIVSEIEKLEGENDPKCYATASRLEDFMFGTPLSDEARSTKNDLQKELVLTIWQSASSVARAAGGTQVTARHISQAMSALFTTRQDADGHWSMLLPDGKKLRINNTDKRQYSSIAYSLRAILAVQQEALMNAQSTLLPLSQAAIAPVKNAVDLYTLAVLKIADEMARRDSSRELSAQSVSLVWQQLLATATTTVELAEQAVDTPAASADTLAAKNSSLALTNAVIEQKVRSYATYNQISNQLFVRNLQVYFAKRRWPESADDARDFRNLYTESLILLARDMYKGAEAVAVARGSSVIQERDISKFIETYLPHSVNDYEDVVFFPRLSRRAQVVIEAYDLDAFRDSGLHWRYLQFAISSDGFEARLEPDPFALELLTENIAQAGVLLLRLTGGISRAYDQERIAASHLTEAVALLHAQARANAEAVAVKVADNDVVSSGLAPAPGSGELFTDSSEDVGLAFMHRSSDWLNRLLRSYLRKDENTGIITIPPAFGGSGVAVADINNDGLPDMLLLSGLGNTLYLNTGAGDFEDITATAGLNWVRADDRNPGEARQPLIADLDNDGDQDVVITYVDDQHRVYSNNGDATFTDVTDSAKLGGKGLVGGPATVFDFDNDGLLDIYITYFGDYIHGVLPTLERRNTNGLPNQLFRNKGGFVFENVTDGSGLDNHGWAQAVTHTDIDSDGLQDVIVGNDFGVNAYYKNLGNGKFADIAQQLGTDKPSYTMGIGIADLNADLLPDFYISNIVTMNKDQKYVLPSADTTMEFNPDKLANMRVIEANDLFLSQTELGQQDYLLSSAVERGYSSTGWSWGAEFFDSDNDGDDDLYVVNGMNEFNLYSSENPYYTDPQENQKKNVYIPVETKESNVFFVNRGGKLNNVSRDSGLDLLGNSRSAAYLDYDADGDLDIVLNNYHEAAHFYSNNAAATNAWLKVRLVGDASKGVNRDAIGARVIVRDSTGRTRWREVRGSSGYMTVQAKEQHFGLGDTEVVSLEVIWPNGERQFLQGVEAMQTLTIAYGADPALSTAQP